MDLRKHVYILGQTGTGKTTMLMSMIMERLDSGAGVGLIDPHGDLSTNILKHLPAKRKTDLIVFDPAQRRNQIALNMLEYNPKYPEQKTFIVHEMFDLFLENYHLETMGPMFELYMRNAMLLVMDNPVQPGTLTDIVRVFRDEVYRNELIEMCADIDVNNFWKGIAENAGYDVSIKNIAPYVVSKLNKFVQNHYIQPIISKNHSSINFRELIDERKVFIARLTKGKIGNQGVKLIGSILFNKLFMAALSRENIDEGKRMDFYLFVDEFQNFTSDSIASMLSEARKYHLNLVLANQTLGQLKKEILQALLGNVGSLVSFRPGIEDADKIHHYLSPTFNTNEIIKVPNFYAIARLQTQNKPIDPFIFQTIPFESYV